MRTDPEPATSCHLPSLAGAGCLRRPGLERVFSAIDGAGGKALVVGGAVRDLLLGRKAGDVDVATTLEPDAVMAVARAAGIRAVPTGIAHGTVTLVVQGKAIEVTTLRRDVKTDGRRAVVVFTTDWRMDARRRDFTMNALYAGLDGQIFDPVRGIGDLLARRVRFIGDAERRIAEDYLRILRFFRFHAELGHGNPDPAGLAACRKSAPGLVRLSAERVRHELMRIMAAPGAVATVEIMAAAGILAQIGLDAVNILRLTRMAAIEEILDQPGDAVLRFAALTLGAGHDAESLTNRFRLSNAEGRRVCRLEAEKPEPGLASDSRSLRKLSYDLGRPALMDQLKFAWASGDAAVDSVPWREKLREAEQFNPPRFPLGARDLLALGAQPGPELGRALAGLEAYWLDGDFRAGRAELLTCYQAKKISTP